MGLGLGFFEEDLDLTVAGLVTSLTKCRFVCVIQIEEYNTRVEQVGGIGNSNYQYVVDMVIKPQ